MSSGVAAGAIQSGIGFQNSVINASISELVILLVVMTGALYIVYSLQKANNVKQKASK